MKKNKGFTLIELLVIIALMLSLLGIAIISFVNVSNKKKEQAYKLVKEQAVTAGEEFFDTNLYIFDGLSVNDTSGIITIGKLVNEDYLNVLTDPRTGKKINKCDYVEVTRTNSGYKTKYVESNSTNCQDTENTIVVEEAGAPSIEINKDKEIDGDNGWYKTKPSIYATVKTNNNGPITDVKSCTGSDEGSCDFKTDEVISNNKTNKRQISDTSGITIGYKATNSSNKTAVAWTTLKVDTEKPTCEYSVDKKVASNGWYNTQTGKPVLTFTGTDALSGINGSDRNIPTITEGKQTYSHTFKDKAGNTNDCSVTINYDGTKPSCPSDWNIADVNTNKYTYCNTGYSQQSWHCADVKISVSKGKDWYKWGWDNGDFTSSGVSNGRVTKTYSGERNIASVSLKISDEAGNITSCNSGNNKFGIDHVGPTMSTPTKNCLLANGGCHDDKSKYYSHTFSINDEKSGPRKGTNNDDYFYNHCYDKATNGQKNLQCGNYKTGGVNANTIKYSSYAPRSEKEQAYAFPKGIEKYYHLFYEIVDNAGNVTYYRYKMTYNPKENTSSMEYVGKLPN